MNSLAAALFVRRLAAASAVVAIAAIALAFCVCKTPIPRATGECHESVGNVPPRPSPNGAWSSDCCCAGDPRLPPGTLEARAPEAQRGASLLATAGAFATRPPAVDVASVTPAPPWLVAASPAHAPPSAFVLPLRV